MVLHRQGLGLRESQTRTCSGQMPKGLKCGLGSPRFNFHRHGRHKKRLSKITTLGNLEP